MKIKLSDHFTYRRLIRFVLPSVCMMVFTSIYGVVDGLFVSNFAGKTAFSAINLVMPFLMIFGAVGFMLGTGGSALVARKLGEGEPETANRCFTMMILVAVISGALLSALGIAVARPVSYLLGADEQMIEDCVTYSRINLVFNTAFMLQNLFQAFFVTAEKPQLGLLFTVSAGVTNMIGDALLVGALHMGTAGAAIATGLSQCIGGVIPLFYFARKNTSLLRLRRTRLEPGPILKACGNGSSEMMSNISGSVVSMVYNFQLMRYVGADGVAAYGVLMYVSFIFVAIYIGYSVGSAPIVGFHYGAGNREELHNMLHKSRILMLITGVCMTLAAEALAAPIAFVFVGYDEALYALTVRAFRIFALSFILSGTNIYLSSFFTALSNGGVSAAISFLRTLVFQLLSVLLLPLFLGIDGIWWALTVADALAFVVALLFLKTKQKKYGY